MKIKYCQQTSQLLLRNLLLICKWLLFDKIVVSCFSLPVISEQQARSALLELCSAKCCYGSKAAEQMSITHMNSTSAFHVRFSLKYRTTLLQCSFAMSFYLRNANEAASSDTFSIVLTICGLISGDLWTQKRIYTFLDFSRCENVTWILFLVHTGDIYRKEVDRLGSGAICRWAGLMNSFRHQVASKLLLHLGRRKDLP